MKTIHPSLATRGLVLQVKNTSVIWKLWICLQLKYVDVQILFTEITRTLRYHAICSLSRIPLARRYSPKSWPAAGSCPDFGASSTRGGALRPFPPLFPLTVNT